MAKFLTVVATIGHVFALILTFFDLIISTIIESFFLAWDFLINKIIFGFIGRLLLGLLMIWFIGAVISNNHPEILEAISEIYCESYPTRLIIANTTAKLAPVFEQLICIFNLIMSFISTLIFQLIPLILECANWEEILINAGRLVASILQLTVEFLIDPFNRRIEILRLWVPYEALLNSLESSLSCVCHDLNFVVEFAFKLIRSQELLCFIDSVVNGALQIVQIALKAILIGGDYSFVPAFNDLCTAANCAGIWIDHVITSLIDLITIPIDTKIGCMLAKIVCIVIDLLSVFIEFIVRLFKNDPAFFTGLDFTPLITHLYELGDCIRNGLGLIDICLGETFGNLVKLVGDILEFVFELLQNGTFDISVVADGLERFLGDDRYGPTSAHMDPAVNPPRHQNPSQQTSLACLISKLLGNTECAKAFGDLTRAVTDIIMVPFLILEEILNSTLSIGSGNPLKKANINAFNTYILDIIFVVLDRILVLVDYIGHLIACYPGLGGLGNALVSLVAALNTVLEEVVELILLIVELVVQFFIWIMTFFGADPFGDGSIQEGITFGNLFLKLLVSLFEVFLEILEFLVNALLFPWFPQIFGQGNLLGNNPGTATLTACIGNIGDCLCGLMKKFLNICLPFNIGCLGDLFGDCGLFEPGRKRFITSTFWSVSPTTGELYEMPFITPPPNMTLWEYFATQFNDTVCGNTYNKWIDGPDGMTDFEKIEYVACVTATFQSLKYSRFIFGNETDGTFFVNPSGMNYSREGLSEALGAMFSSDLQNLAAYYTSPSGLTGDPFNVVNYTDPYSSGLLDGIDPMSIQLASGIRTSITDITSSLYQSLNATHSNSSSSWSGLLYGAGTAMDITGKSTGMMLIVLEEIYNHDVVNNFIGGFGELLTFMNTTITENVPENTIETPVVEKISFALDGAKEYTLDNFGGLTLYPSKSDFLFHNFSKAYTGLSENALYLLGQPSSVNSYGSQVTLNNHVENSCSSIGLFCNGPSNCTGDELFSVFGVCHEFFGYGITVKCNDTAQEVTFYTDRFCRTKINTVIASNGTDVCVNFNTTTPFGTFEICVVSDGCTACPTNKVFPGFECRWLDEVVHRIGTNIQRCVQKIASQLDEPITVFIPFPTPTPPFTTTPTWTVPTIFEGICGDGILDVGEQCDDGNTNDGDGCNSRCQFERCGNGIKQSGEECDDGNNIAGDGCFNCTLEYTCGNGILESSIGEECDDGNTRLGDGCDSSCQLEICPQVILGIQPTSATQCFQPKIQGFKPVGVIDGTDKSVTINCIADPPVMYVHLGLGGSGPIIKTIYITEPCGTQEGACVGPLLIDGKCSQYVTVGSDFTCTKECSVCGDGIVGPGEECDDGTLLDQDDCIQCKESCTCSLDSTKPCFGTCVGGLRDGETCYPRSEVIIYPDVNITISPSFLNGKIITLKSLTDFSAVENAVRDPFTNNRAVVLARNPDTSGRAMRWRVVQVPESPNFVYLQSLDVIDQPRYMGRCFGCENQVPSIPSGTCGQNPLGALAFAVEANPNVQNQFVIQQNGPNPNHVSVVSVASGLYMNEVTAYDAVCFDSTITGTDTTTWYLEIITPGTECSDGGGVCRADSCCGDGIVQSRSIQPDSNAVDVYSETNQCEQFDPSSCTACVPNDCDFSTTIREYPDGFTRMPTVGQCFLGDYDGEECLLYPSLLQLLTEPELFAWNISQITDAGIRIGCFGSPGPNGERINDGACIPKACCGDYERQEDVGFIDLVREEYCDFGGYYDVLNPDTCAEGFGHLDFPCTWECGLFGLCGQGLKKRSIIKPQQAKDLIQTDPCDDDITLEKRNAQQDFAENALYNHFASLLTSISTTNMTTNSTYKDDFILNGIYQIGDWIIDAVTSILGLATSSTSTLESRIIQFFTNTDIDKNQGLDEMGLLGYLTFHFYCSSPQNLDCERGLGTLPGLGITLLIFLIAAFVFVCVCGNAVTPICSLFFTVAFIPIFLQLSYFYSVACMPRVPECIGYELAEVAQVLNETCINWPDGLVTSPMDGSCPGNCSDIEIVDCKAIGWIDGFDNLIYILEVYFPEVMVWFRTNVWVQYIANSFLFSWLTQSEYMMKTLERFDYGGQPPPNVDKVCFWVTILNLSHVLIAMVLLGIIIVPLVILALNLLRKLFYLLILFATLLLDIQRLIDEEKEDNYSF